MSSPHLLVLTPSLGRVSLGYRDTFARLTLECARRDIKISVSDATDPGQLVHARNVLLAAAVDSDATHALWWDADVAFEPAAVFDLLERPEAMICRPYPMRNVDWQAAIDWVRELNFDAANWRGRDLAADIKRSAQRWTTMLEYENGKPIWSQDGKLVRVAHCGFGWVLHKVEAIHGSSRKRGQVPEKDWKDRRVVRAFDLWANEYGVISGEDISFCARWRNRYIWAAPDRHVQNGDHGGRFADYLEAHGLTWKA